MRAPLWRSLTGVTYWSRERAMVEKGAESQVGDPNAGQRVSISVPLSDYHDSP